MPARDRAMKIFQCQACDQPVTFEATGCESCERRLGYVCARHEVSALEPAGFSTHPRMGGAQIFHRHANIIVNLGGATAAEVRGLIDLARTTVARELGYELRPEIGFIGEF